MTERLNGDCQAVLFDLDGTLIDTAPDMVRILRDMLVAYDAPDLPYARVRSVVSNGSLGLVRLGFPSASDALLKALQQEYLDRYEADVCRDSTLFPGLAELLVALETAQHPWGIVTNKPERMTTPLVEQLGLGGRSACTVSGDTLPQRKPNPEPLWHACRLAKLDPSRTLYVGDAERDIAAGRAAGMPTLAAAYGYITEDDDPAGWGADAIAGNTQELRTLIAKAVSLTVDA
ncbi:MAG: HAD-IA family hydrolase [Pseudomonadota bacterium]